jgi:hypothetical protein
MEEQRKRAADRKGLSYRPGELAIE